MRTLIRQGLSLDNLDQLVDLARQLFYGRPALYGSLISVFKRLSQEFDDQGIIEIARLTAIESTFQAPLIAAINAQYDPDLLQRLDDLHKAVFTFT
jgi:hypothetical protein